MTALLDTHALLWWLTDDRRLSRRARQTVERDEILVSVISPWEIEIKKSLGRIVPDTRSVLEEVTGTSGFAWLDIGPAHVAALAGLPLLHRDPFDRMLVAQAKLEHVPLVTDDRNLRRYEIETIW